MGGKKQLLCMARALLNKNKLILMDEATASIDVVTEVKIQNAITQFFKDSTVLMIAHRLNTIMFCDKILVMSKGEVQEFDELNKLRDNPQSEFGRMLAVSKDIKTYME